MARVTFQHCGPWLGALGLCAAVGGSILAASVAEAQGVMRAPNLRIENRIPLSPTIAGRAPGGLSGGIAARPTLPTQRFSPNLTSTCSAPDRGADGECIDRSSGAGGRKRDKGHQNATADKATGDKGGGDKGNGGSAQHRERGQAAAAAADPTVIADEIVAELDGSLSDAQTEALARRHGLVRVASENVPLIGATIGLLRITDRRPIERVRRELAGEAGVRGAQPNFRYLLQDDQAPSEGDPAQYALGKLRLPQAHQLAQGANVTVAVIDSGVDLAHPEFAAAAMDGYDALGSTEGPHVHGTGIAGVIVAHARLMGSAPAARILAIRAFGTVAKAKDKASGKGPESSTYVILKSLDYAAGHGAQIINMSFAGPKDPLIELAVAKAASQGILLVAAAGNAGAKSPPLYPAANPNVIAVSATDARDQLLPASNRGNHIALAAPGADIFLPAPEGKYQMTSGTSFSAAYVSGLAALVLERNHALKPNEVRTALTTTARDLGAPGPDELFGAGEADAYAAVQAIMPVDAQAPAMSAAPPASQRDVTGDAMGTRELRAATPPVSAMATDRSSSGAMRPAQQ